MSKCCNDYRKCEMGCPFFDKIVDVTKKKSLAYFKFKLCMILKPDEPFTDVLDAVTITEYGKAVYEDDDICIQTDAGYFKNLLDRVENE